MKRLFALGLVIALANASAASGGEPLLTAAARAVSASRNAAQPKSDEGSTPLVSFAKSAGVREPAVAAQPGGAISTTGLSKRTKAMIYIGVVAAFAGIAYSIDHNVRDVTPSTLGTRQD